MYLNFFCLYVAMNSFETYSVSNLNRNELNVYLKLNCIQSVIIQLNERVDVLK